MIIQKLSLTLELCEAYIHDHSFEVSKYKPCTKFMRMIELRNSIEISVGKFNINREPLTGTIL